MAVTTAARPNTAAEENKAVTNPAIRPPSTSKTDLVLEVIADAAASSDGDRATETCTIATAGTQAVAKAASSTLSRTTSMGAAPVASATVAAPITSASGA